MQFVDLTHTISEDMQVYPGTEPPTLNVPCTVEKDGFKETEIRFYSHTGTHMDSPAHIFKDGKTLDQLTIDYFYGRGVVIDCRDVGYGEKIGDKIIQYFEGSIEDYDYILFYTSWQEKWGSYEYYEGFPTISKELAKRLSELNIKGIGIDAISVDPVSSHMLEAHQEILRAGKLIIENLKNLDQLLDKEFDLCVFPLKFENADGSPIRAVAILR